MLVKYLLRWLEINITSKIIRRIYNWHSWLRFFFLTNYKIFIWICFLPRINSRLFTLIFYFRINEALCFLKYTHLTLFFLFTSWNYMTFDFRYISMIIKLFLQKIGSAFLCVIIIHILINIFRLILLILIFMYDII